MQPSAWQRARWQSFDRVLCALAQKVRPCGDYTISDIEALLMG